MDNFEPNDMDKYEYDYNHNSNTASNGTGRRKPQRSPTVTGQGGFSQGGQDIGEGSDDPDKAEINFREGYGTPHQQRYVDDDNVSDDDNESVDGEEGREDNHIKIPGYGYIKFKTIFTALARHDDCECHRRPLPGPRRLSESGTLDDSNIQSVSSSMVVEHHNSADRSPENSAMWITRSQTPSEFDFFIGSLYVDDMAFPPTPLVFNPLPLSAELIFARNVDGPFHYAMDLSFTEHDEGEDEMRNFPL
jgi:hypothetical protein